MNKEELERNVSITTVIKALKSRDILRDVLAEIDVFDLDDVVERVSALVMERKEQEKQAGIEQIKLQMKRFGVDLSDLKEPKTHNNNKEVKTRASSTIDIIYNGETYKIKSVGRPDPRTKGLLDSLGYQSKKQFIEDCQAGLVEGVELLG